MSENQTLFISYRREDSAGWAGRLQADLRSRLGPDVQVFMDIDGIPAGEDFARAIDDAVGRCGVLVALIGPGWLSAQDAQGRRRLEDPNDFVRIEIEAALRRGIRVIPALVGDASLPGQEALPEPLRELIKRQAVRLDNDTWSLGLTRLVKAIGPTSHTDAPPRLALSANRLDFGVLTLHEDWPRRTVQIRNTGGGELNAMAATTESWIVLRNRNDAVDVLVDTSNPGEYDGRITVSSAGGTASIAVSAAVKPEPAPQAGRSTPSTRPNPRWYRHGAVAAGLTVVVIAALAVAVVLLLQNGEPPRGTITANPPQTVASPASPTRPETPARSVAPPRPPGPADVRALPAGLFCRDLNARGYSYSAAVDYWRMHGQPNQMDADRNGIPCETVYPRSDVSAYWGP